MTPSPHYDSHDLTQTITTVLVLGDEAKSKEERRLVQKLGELRLTRFTTRIQY